MCVCVCGIHMYHFSHMAINELCLHAVILLLLFLKPVVAPQCFQNHTQSPQNGIWDPWNQSLPCPSSPIVAKYLLPGYSAQSLFLTLTAFLPYSYCLKFPRSGLKVTWPIKRVHSAHPNSFLPPQRFLRREYEPHNTAHSPATWRLFMHKEDKLDNRN